MMRKLPAAAFVALLSGAAARAESDQVLISYEAKLGATQISGVSHSLQWSAVALGPDSAQVQLRIPVESFESGHPDFDALLRAAAQSEQHPFIEVEGVANGKSFEGTVTVRGVSRPLQLRIGVVHLDGRLVINAAFPLDLAAFGVVVPGAASKVSIEFVGRFPDEPRAVISGGAVSSTP
jgi:polyisoprenoid-binding protein YceI